MNTFYSKQTNSLIELAELNDQKKQIVCLLMEINKAWKLYSGNDMRPSEFDALYDDQSILTLQATLRDLQHAITHNLELSL